MVSVVSVWRSAVIIAALAIAVVVVPVHGLRNEIVNQETDTVALTIGDTIEGTIAERRILLSKTNDRLTVDLRVNPLDVEFGNDYRLTMAIRYGSRPVLDSTASVIPGNVSVAPFGMIYHNFSGPVAYLQSLDLYPFAPNRTLHYESDSNPVSGNTWVYVTIAMSVMGELNSNGSALATGVFEMPVLVRVEIDDQMGSIIAACAAVLVLMLLTFLLRMQHKHNWCSRMCGPDAAAPHLQKSIDDEEEQQEAVGSSDYEYEYKYEDEDEDASSQLDDDDEYEYEYKYEDEDEDASSQLDDDDEYEYEYKYEDEDEDDSASDDSTTRRRKRARKKTASKAGKRGAKRSKTTARQKTVAAAAGSAVVTQGGSRRAQAQDSASMSICGRIFVVMAMSFFRIIFMAFDGIKTIINLQLIAASMQLYLGDSLPDLDELETELDLDDFGKVVFSVNSFLVSVEELTVDVFVYNCGGVLMVASAFVFVFLLAIILVVLARDLLLWVAIRLQGFRKNFRIFRGRVGVMVFAGISALLEAILFLMVQLSVLILPTVAVGIFRVNRSCGEVDYNLRQAMYYGTFLLFLFAFVLFLVTFSGKPRNLGTKGCLAPVVMIIGAAWRLLLLTFGIWTARLMDAHSIFARAATFDDDDEDDDLQHERVLSVLSKSRSVVWFLMPWTIPLAKLLEAVNTPPLIVPNLPHLQMITPGPFRFCIWLFHLATLGAIFVVVFTVEPVWFYTMLATLVPLHFVLLILDVRGL